MVNGATSVTGSVRKACIMLFWYVCKNKVITKRLLGVSALFLIMSSSLSCKRTKGTEMVPAMALSCIDLRCCSNSVIFISIPIKVNIKYDADYKNTHHNSLCKILDFGAFFFINSPNGKPHCPCPYQPHPYFQIHHNMLAL